MKGQGCQCLFRQVHLLIAAMLPTNTTPNQAEREWGEQKHLSDQKQLESQVLKLPNLGIHHVLHFTL